MPSVCFYFQLHQPLRLRRYSVFDTDPYYFDSYLNSQILKRVADRCYERVTALLLKQIQENKGKFRLSLSVTGVAIDQFRQHAPKVIDNLVKLAQTGCVEFLSETYYHSLAFLYSRDEFRQQVEKHDELMEQLFGIRPQVFRNTELIYNNDLAHYIESLNRFKGVITEGSDGALAGRTTNAVYRPATCERISVLLRNYHLSDDVAFRFSNRDWENWPLTAEKFAGWITRVSETGNVANLFMDIETFGEHQWEQTGIFDFLTALPAAVLANKDNSFKTISEAIAAHPPVDTFDVPHMISWADTERDLSAWLGNAMQSNALHELFKLERPIKALADEKLIEDWRRLTISDHFYYMCTKYYADGAVHNYFNPYESPYDSYINFMNVLDNLRTRVGR
jgi:alpha-amylase